MVLVLLGLLVYPQGDEELVKVDGAAAVAVEVAEQGGGLVLLDQQPVVVQALQELLEVQGAVLVVVHDPEGPDRKQTVGATAPPTGRHTSQLHAPQTEASSMFGNNCL